MVCIILGFGTISCMIAVYGKAGSHQSSAHKYNISQSDHTNNQRLTQKIPSHRHINFCDFFNQSVNTTGMEFHCHLSSSKFRNSNGYLFWGSTVSQHLCWLGRVNQHSRDHFLTFKGALRHSHLPSCEKRTRMGTNSFVSVGEIYNFKSAHKQHSFSHL